MHRRMVQAIARCRPSKPVLRYAAASIHQMLSKGGWPGRGHVSAMRTILDWLETPVVRSTIKVLPVKVAWATPHGSVAPQSRSSRNQTYLDPRNHASAPPAGETRFPLFVLKS